MKNRFNRMKVENKVNLIMIILSICMLSIVILITSVRSIMINDTMLNDYFNEIAKEKAYLTKYKIDLVDTTIAQIGRSISLLDNIQDKDEYTSNSVVYNDLMISAGEAELEKMILEHTWSAIEALPLIKSIGVYFEPYILSSKRSGYAFKADREDLFGEEVTIFNTYDDYAQQAFYSEVFRNSSKHLTTLNPDNVDEYVISISRPIIIGEKIIGVIVAEILWTEFDDIGKPDSKYEGLALNVMTSDFTVLYDPVEDKIGVDASKSVQEYSAIEVKNNMQKREAFACRTYGFTGIGNILQLQERFFAPMKLLDQTWWIHIGVKALEIYNDILQTMLTSLITAIVSIIVLSTTIRILNKKLFQPLSGLKSIAQSIEMGQLSTKVEPTYDDDIGQLTNNFNNMGTTIHGIIKEIELLLAEMSKGNFLIEDKIKANYEGDFRRIKESIINIAIHLKQTLKSISESSTEVSIGAEEIAVSATHVSMASQDQNNSVLEFIEITEEMATMVEEINSQIMHSANLGNMAISTTAEGKEMMNEMLKSMNNISVSSKNIFSVLDILQSISKKTNLLALNAAIEASRAGESGKSFAVVANEIRELANTSSDTVKEIEDVIQKNLNLSEGGQEIADKTAEYFDKVANKIEESTIISNNLLDMSNSQKDSIKTLVNNIKQLAENVVENAASSEESMAISNSLAKQATNLESLMKEFKF
ncbi:hypothetical protein AN643_02680 [Candidatus Epulonipiscioides saccharophilum]|nr:hypothetical protein AN643_02680 [Epulopiscium sp. SCG-B10WGA-EpuloB]